MSAIRIASLTFIPADGEPPPNLELEALPPASAVFAVVSETFGPYLLPDARVESCQVWPPPIGRPARAGLHVIYLYGHAWLTDGRAEISVSSEGASKVLSAKEVLNGLAAAFAIEQTVLFVDTCHAEAFAPALDESRIRPRFVVFASAADESAIALSSERTSRFSLALHQEMARATDKADLAALISRVSHALDRDTVIAGQTVSYRMHGPQITLTRTALARAARRDVTSRRIRQRLVVAGAVVTVMIGAAEEFYRRNTWIEIDLSSMASFGNRVDVSVALQTPNENKRELWLNSSRKPDHVRLRVPASNLVLRLEVDAADRRPVMLSYHLLLKPGLQLQEKLRRLAVPSTSEIDSHPGMTFVPPTNWIQGQDLKAAQTMLGYWIDVAPPTVEQYLPIVQSWADSGKINVDESVLLQTLERQRAIKAVGLEQLNTLNNQLGEVFGIIAQADSMHVEAPGDIAEGLGEIPCDDCPAPMTRYEAIRFCESRGFRLPTDAEWELAARGVDGRLFPWGNRFDESKANVGLPTEVGIPKKLQPVMQYLDARSPFGLIDLVGNAGDWVINESEAYERIYMGATYRYNPEDATTFRSLPVTDSYNLQEITARCADD